MTRFLDGLRQLFSFVDDYRTKLLAIVMLGVGVAQLFDVLTMQQANGLFLLLGGPALYTLRSGVQKVQKQIEHSTAQMQAAVAVTNVAVKGKVEEKGEEVIAEVEAAKVETVAAAEK